jgi:catechol 2,3-dioxygenase-like lactoylglutathione lyase family enzyme
MEKVNVRYIVNDVDAAIQFYTGIFEFKLEKHPAPGFALLSKGNLHLLLNRPGSAGAGQSMDDGRVPAPGGWSQFQIQVPSLADTVVKLRAKGCRFRNEIVIGTGGK